jgi:hypothetical protein
MLLAACSSMPEGDGTATPARVPPAAVTGPDPGERNPPGPTWADVVDRIYRAGYYDFEGVHRMRGGCWMADTFVERMKTEIFVDRDGVIYVEFPPPSCG